MIHFHVPLKNTTENFQNYYEQPNEVLIDARITDYHYSKYCTKLTGELLKTLLAVRSNFLHEKLYYS